LKPGHRRWPLYQLAEVLHKAVWEVELMPLDELEGWMQYFKLRE